MCSSDLFNYIPQVKNKFMGRLVSGCISGFTCATTSISGPPVALYFFNEGMSKVSLRANMVWIFSLGSFFTLVSFFVSGTFEGNSVFIMSIYIMPAVFVGWWVGDKLFYKVNQTLFKKIALIIILLGALMSLYNGVKGFF